MALDQVAELARQAAANKEVLNALQNEPSKIRTPLNLSESHLRALISAGSFTTAKPVFTTSATQPSLAHEIANLEVGTLFPPEGQGQFPVPGELPPTLHSPGSAPVPRAPSIGSPQTTAPGSSPVAPVTGATPQPRRAPSAAPTAGHPISPQAPGATPGSAGTPQQGTPTGSGSGQSAQGTHMPESDANSEATPCCSCVVAMVSIVAEISTLTQTALSAITAIAGLS